MPQCPAYTLLYLGNRHTQLPPPNSAYWSLIHHPFVKAFNIHRLIKALLYHILDVPLQHAAELWFHIKLYNYMTVSSMRTGMCLCFAATDSSVMAFSKHSITNSWTTKWPLLCLDLLLCKTATGSQDCTNFKCDKVYWRLSSTQHCYLPFIYWFQDDFQPLCSSESAF